MDSMLGTITTKVGYFNIGDEVEVLEYDREFGVMGYNYWVKNLTQGWVGWLDKRNAEWR